MHLQIDFIQPTKLEFLNSPTSNSLFDHNLSFQKLHQYSYRNFYTHHTRHINKKYCFTNDKFLSPHSSWTKYALDFSYLHGAIRIYDPLKEYFINYCETNPHRLLIVPREGLSIHDPHFYVLHNQPPPPLTSQTHSLFHFSIFQPIPPTVIFLKDLLSWLNTLLYKKTHMNNSPSV